MNELRKLFAELKPKCRTKGQMQSFNELVKTFADSRYIMINYGKKGGWGWSAEEKKKLEEIFIDSVIKACDKEGLSYESTKLDWKGKNRPEIIIEVSASGRIPEAKLDKFKESIYDALEDNGFNTVNSSLWLNEVDHKGRAFNELVRTFAIPTFTDQIDQVLSIVKKGKLTVGEVGYVVRILEQLKQRKSFATNTSKFTKISQYLDDK